MPEGIPDPDTLPDFHERMAPHRELVGDYYDRPRPIDTRYCEASPFDRHGDLPPFQNVWMKANGKLPDDPVLQVCVLTYASDLTLLDTSLLPNGDDLGVGEVFMASLDHAMWFHRPFRADEWLLYDQQSPSAHGGRGLGQGRIYTQDGRLAVSVIQEGVVRVPRP